MRSLLIMGTFFICAAGAWGQDWVADRSFPHCYSGELKVVSFFNYCDTLFLLTYDNTRAYCQVKRPGFDWTDRFSFNYNQLTPSRFRYYISQTGHSYVYSRQNGTLYTNFPEWPFDPEWRLCPGNPIIDSQDDIHLIWHGSNDYYYGFSQDTLRSYVLIDTLALPSSNYLVSSPDNSKIALLCLNQARNTIYKFITNAGQPINFADTVAITIDPAYSYLKDITLDYAGNIHFVATHDGYPPNTHYMHYAWSELYGYRYLDMQDDDGMTGANFELTFGPDNEIVIIESMDYYYQNGSVFFATTDGGNNWLTVSNDQFSNSVIHGTAPRRFSDKIDFIFYAPGSVPFSISGIYYYPIPHASIFNNLTAIEEGEADIPPSQYQPDPFNYPNPFGAGTSIKLELKKTSYVGVAIYDMTGRLVRGIQPRSYNIGINEIRWDGRGDGGRYLPSGTYFYRFIIDYEFSGEAHKMTILH